MPDPYLMAQLHGEFNIKVSQDPEYEMALEKLAEDYADQEAESLVQSSQLFTKTQAKLHLKKQFKEAVLLPEQQTLLNQAVRCVLEDGKRYLGEEDWGVLSSEMSHASEILSKLSYQEEIPEKLFPFLGMTQKGMNAIDTIARAKYKEENFSAALALNALLATLNPETLIYWLHLGICYQDCGFFEKATRAYSVCHLLDPTHIPAWIFCAECYHKVHHEDDAKIEYEEVTRIVASLEDATPWKETLTDLKRCLGL